MTTVYLDHNATTPLRPESREAMLPILGSSFGNPSSVHRFGQEARAAVDVARRRVSSLVGGEGGDLVFTASGTEAVLSGVLGASRAAGRPGHAVISAIEHPAGLAAGEVLEEEGWRITRVSSDRQGLVSPAAVEAALTGETVLVSVLHANNETGTIQPVRELAALCRERGILFHVDAVQSAGKLPLAVGEWGVDLLSVASHKLGGPKGAGALWRRGGVRVRPLLPGSQEGGLRGGTVDVAAVVGFGAAAEAARAGLDAYRAHTTALRDRLEGALRRELPEAAVTGAESPRLSNTTHLTFAGDAEADLVLALDLAGFALASGAACRSGATDPSHVLLAMGMSPSRARSALRVSVGMETTPVEIDAFVAALQRLVAPRPEQV
jgi:cysteine desulfurase